MGLKKMKETVSDLRFRWLKPAKGHVVTRGTPRLKGWSREFEDVTGILLATPGVFREFARIDMGGDRMLLGEVLGFADVFGDILALPHEEHPTPQTWCDAIQQMRRAVNLWDRIKDSKTSGDAQRRGQQALRIEINRVLTDTVTPSHTTLALTPELGLARCPVNLLAYMWLCLARVVSGEIEERPCEMFTSCGEYIYVGQGPGFQRNDTTTCSAACRQKKKRQDAKATH
jgi:hypothetical protein